MASKISCKLQEEIWVRSATEPIGQLAKRYSISRPTVKKYMNPQFA